MYTCVQVRESLCVSEINMFFDNLCVHTRVCIDCVYACVRAHVYDNNVTYRQTNEAVSATLKESYDQWCDLPADDLPMTAASSNNAALNSSDIS